MSWRDQRKVVRFWHRVSLTMKSRCDFLSLSICSTEAVVAIRAIVKAFIMYKTYLWLGRNEGMDPYSRTCIIHHSLLQEARKSIRTYQLTLSSSEPTRCTGLGFPVAGCKVMAVSM